MNLLKQDKPQCLLYAFAMVVDRTPEDLIHIIGHDGLEVLWPEASGDSKYRGFHHQEIVDSLVIMGWNVMMVEALPNLGYKGKMKIIYTESELQGRMNTYLQAFDGVLTSDTHAVAWDHSEQKCYDPNGYTYGIDNFSVREFFIVTRGNYEDTERLRWTIQRSGITKANGSTEAGVIGRSFAGG